MADLTWIGAMPDKELAQLLAPCISARAVSVRPQLAHAAKEALLHPWRTSRVLVSGHSFRDALAFAAWSATAPALGIHRVVDEHGHLLTRLPYRDAKGDRAARVTAVIIAQNEAQRLPATLDSLRNFAVETLVVDGGSTDDTVSIAEAAGARVIRRAFDNELAQRQVGLAAVATEWVIQLDADEILSDDLAALLREALDRGGFDAVVVPFLEEVEGYPELANWPDLHLRLFRSSLSYSGTFHTEVVGWKRALYTPVSGPFILHRKSALRFFQAASRYAQLDPTRFTAHDLEYVYEQLRLLEGGGGAPAAVTGDTEQS